MLLKKWSKRKTGVLSSVATCKSSMTLTRAGSVFIRMD